MRRTLALAASLLALVALASIGANAAAAKNPHPTYTCTKPKKNGDPDVRVSVPEAAVSGLTNAGFTCVADVPGDDDQQGDDQNQQGDDENEQGEEQGQDESESQGDEEEGDGHPTVELAFSTVADSGPSESRAVYCSTKGPVGRAEGNGVALNLPVSQGALLVEQGVATPGIFYVGVGVSCDLLPGYVYSGVWVDNVGDVVPGVAVYPYYVTAA